ncbi:MAG: hypothetical protein K2Y05_07830 [Hyphomicrobiaceae bacterium]|nr:hypothetical protein [Hyphomicrobiaceae bacterium]
MSIKVSPTLSDNIAEHSSRLEQTRAQQFGWKEAPKPQPVSVMPTIDVLKQRPDPAARRLVAKASELQKRLDQPQNVTLNDPVSSASVPLKNVADR